MILLPRPLSVHLILQVNTFTFGDSLSVALSANLVTFICVEQVTPGRPRSSSTLLASYAIFFDGKTIVYHLLEVNSIVFSRLIGNCFTVVSKEGSEEEDQVEEVVVVVVGVDVETI